MIDYYHAGQQNDDNINTDDNYNAFVEKLIVDLGFDKVQEPEKSELIKAIQQRIEARILSTLMTSLTEQRANELDEQIEKEGLKEQQIIELLAKEPGASAKIIQAMDDLYQEMKEETDALWAASAAKASNK